MTNSTRPTGANQRPLRAVAYTRVSTDRQADSGLGLDDQLESIERHIQLRSWERVHHAEDAGISGKAMSNRHALNAAVAMLDAGDADVLVAAKLDRLSRSTIDLATLLERSSKRGWKLVVLDADVDTSTPAGEMVVSVLGAMARFESRRIGERVAAAHAQRRKVGILPGPEPILSEDVRARIVGLRVEGLSLQSVADVLNADGTPTALGGRWHSSTVRHIERSVRLRGA